MVERKRQRVTEATIEKQILIYLASRKIFAWKVKTVGTYDPRKRVFRKTPWFYRKGVPDIHGFHIGTPFVIEVKSEDGRLSPDQVTFKNEWLDNSNGFYVLARSVDDVEYALAQIEARNP